MSTVIAKLESHVNPSRQQAKNKRINDCLDGIVSLAIHLALHRQPSKPHRSLALDQSINIQSLKIRSKKLPV
jgi:hypothetical protein